MIARIGADLRQRSLVLVVDVRVLAGWVEDQLTDRQLVLLRILVGGAGDHFDRVALPFAGHAEHRGLVRDEVGQIDVHGNVDVLPGARGVPLPAGR